MTASRLSGKSRVVAPPDLAARPSEAVLIAGAGSRRGRQLATGLALSGIGVTLADPDLTAVDRLSEWLRSLGCVTTVEAGTLDEFLVGHYAERIRGVVDARAADAAETPDVAALAMMSGRSLRPGGFYMRVDSSTGTEPAVPDPALVALALARGIGLILVRTAPDLSEAMARILLSCACAAVREGLDEPVSMTLGTQVEEAGRNGHEHGATAGAGWPR